MENASAAFLTCVQRSMVAIRKAVGAGTVDPEALRAVERRQHTGWLRREAENADILALSAQGVAIKEIMRRTDKSRGLVRQVVRGGCADIFRVRMNSLDPFMMQLETDWTGGSRRLLPDRSEPCHFSGLAASRMHWKPVPYLIRVPHDFFVVCMSPGKPLG